MRLLSSIAHSPRSFALGASPGGGFGCSANGGILGDLGLGVGGDFANCGIVGDRDRDDDAGSDEVAPDAKASGGAACLGFRLPADLKGPISN